MVSPTPHPVWGASVPKAPGSAEGGGWWCWGLWAADGFSRVGARAEPRTCEQTGLEFTIKGIK